LTTKAAETANPPRKRVRTPRTAKASAPHARAVVSDESVATTLRLDPAVRHGLTLIRRSTGATMNKLVNEAVALYVADRVKTIEHDLQTALDRIRQYHAIDPTYAAQARAIADEEAAHTRSDPLAGRMVAERGPAPKREPNSRARRRHR
jgi:hypothetical protein